jgi:20S proteasome subunit alpha 1
MIVIAISSIIVTGDGMTLAHKARNQAAEFRFKWGYEMPPDILAQW